MAIAERFGPFEHAKADRGGVTPCFVGDPHGLGSLGSTLNEEPVAGLHGPGGGLDQRKDGRPSHEEGRWLALRRLYSLLCWTNLATSAVQPV